MDFLDILRTYPGGVSRLIADTKLAKATVYAHAAGDKPFSEDVCTRIAEALEKKGVEFPVSCVLEGDPTYLGAVVQLWAEARRVWLMDELSKSVELKMRKWN